MVLLVVDCNQLSTITQRYVIWFCTFINQYDCQVGWNSSAIFAGIDPSDGKFFVAKKSVFNVSPKLYKTDAEIDEDLSGDLNAKFKVALAEFSKLGITGVIQGDLMFTDDLSKETIEGVSYYTFQPNTIVYAVPVDSDLGKINEYCKDRCRMAHNLHR